MVINFITPTLLSPLDLTSMGDSVKRNDDSKIGCFGSGMSYAVALLLRNDVEISIDVNDEKIKRTFTFTTECKDCNYTNKSKKLIGIREYHNNVFYGYHQTSFSIELGFNWGLWMSLRELYSNSLDEKGEFEYFEGDDNPRTLSKFGTLITLKCKDDSEFAEIVKNRDRYILNPKYLLANIGEGIDIYENVERHLKIYKNTILVYEDENVVSKFCYNIPFGKIDERRILNDVYSVGSSIMDVIRTTKCEDFLRLLITPTQELDENDWLNQFTNYSNGCSKKASEIACEIYNEHADVHAPKFLLNAIRKQDDCGIPGRIIKNLNDHYWGYRTDVKIVNIPVKEIDIEDILGFPTVKDTLKSRIEALYNFSIGDVELQEAELDGAKAIFDKYKKCIILDVSFNPETDFGEFVVQYFSLTKNENIIKCLSNYIASLLRRG